MIVIEPIGYVRAARNQVEDDFWGGVESTIVLTDSCDPGALLGIEDFSHAEILFSFDQVAEEKIRCANTGRPERRSIRSRHT